MRWILPEKANHIKILRSFDELPPNLKKFVKFVVDLFTLIILSC